MGGGEAPWVWEDDLVHAESGLALECGTGKCGEPHYRWQKWLLLLCNLSTWPPSPGPTPQTEPAVSPGAETTVLLPQRLTVLREARRPRGRDDSILYAFTCREDRLASAPLGRQGASRQRPRFQPRLPGLLRTSSHNRKTMPKTPELLHTTPSQGAGWARHSHGRSRSEVTRLGREVGRGALYTLCEFLLHIREAGGVKRRPSRKTLHSDPKTHLLEENIEVEGVGPACWRLGDEGQGCQVVDG